MKKLLPDHPRHNPPDSTEMLPLGEGIVGIGDIDRHFCEATLL